MNAAAWYDDEPARKALVVRPDDETLAAIQTLMTTHGHTLTPEQRAAVRGWLGRTA